jgi:NADH:ubiquinone oxidoreductase subunit C
MKTLFDTYTEKEIEDILKKILVSLESRVSDKEIIEKNKIEFIEELLSIAKARKRARESKPKFIDAKYFNLEDLRFSTSKDVADYRAKRLSCNRIVDLCCGIGSQSLAFLTTCKNVLAIDIDKRKIAYAKMNDKSAGIKFICEDILSEEAINIVKNFQPEIIFCDPERLEAEEERNLESIKPDIRKIIEIYSRITPNLCIEIPPQINFSKLKELEEFGEFEAEYISFNNKLNRLNLCFGNLKKCEVSVVDVFGTRIEKNIKAIKAKTANKLLNYLYEASTAIIKAGLENEFANKIRAEILDEDKTKLLLTSNEASKTKETKAFSKIYKILGFSDNFNGIIKILRDNKAGKVVLKKKISPENYWQERKKYEKCLFGKKEACLFSIKSEKNKEVEIVAEELH